MKFEKMTDAEIMLILSGLLEEGINRDLIVSRPRMSKKGLIVAKKTYAEIKKYKGGTKDEN